MSEQLGYDITYGPILDLKTRYPTRSGDKYLNKFPPMNYNFINKDSHWYFGQIIAWNAKHRVGYIITNNEDAVTTVQEAVILANDPKLKHQSKIKHLAGMHGVTLKLSQEHIHFPQRLDLGHQNIKINAGVLVRFKIARNCITQVFHAINVFVFSTIPILPHYPSREEEEQACNRRGGIRIQHCMWSPKKKLKVILKRQPAKELWDE